MVWLAMAINNKDEKRSIYIPLLFQSGFFPRGAIILIIIGGREVLLCVHSETKKKNIASGSPAK